MSDTDEKRFTAILAKNDIARQCKSGDPNIYVIRECLRQIEEYIGTGNQPSVDDICNTYRNI